MAGVRDRREGRVRRGERCQRQRREGRLAAATEAASGKAGIHLDTGAAAAAAAAERGDSLPGCWQHHMLRTVGILEDLLADQRGLQVPMGDDLPFLGGGGGGGGASGRCGGCCGKWPDVLFGEG